MFRMSWKCVQVYGWGLGKMGGWILKSMFRFMWGALEIRYRMGGWADTVLRLVRGGLDKQKLGGYQNENVFRFMNRACKMRYRMGGWAESVLRLVRGGAWINQKMGGHQDENVFMFVGGGLEKYKMRWCIEHVFRFVGRWVENVFFL